MDPRSRAVGPLALLARRVVLKPALVAGAVWTIPYFFSRDVVGYVVSVDPGNADEKEKLWCHAGGLCTAAAFVQLRSYASSAAAAPHEAGHATSNTSGGAKTPPPTNTSSGAKTPPPTTFRELLPRLPLRYYAVGFCGSALVGGAACAIFHRAMRQPAKATNAKEGVTT